MGAFREVEGKVYYKGEDYWGPNTDTIVLMYDFTAEIGDTVYTGAGQAHIIQDIDSVMIGDQLRKKFHTWDQDWIEGIGCINGFFYPISDIPITYWRVWISCYSIQDEMIYHNPEFQDCYTLVGYEEINLQDKLFVAPNPVFKGDPIVVKNIPEGASINFYDIGGRKLNAQSGTIANNSILIEADNILNGIYILESVSEQERIVKKVIVQ